MHEVGFRDINAEFWLYLNGFPKRADRLKPCFEPIVIGVEVMYQLYNEDCLKVLGTLEEGSIDCVVCDPPYKTQQRGTHGSMGGWFASEDGKNGNGGFKNNDLSIDDYAPLLFNVMKDGAHGYLMTNDLNLVEFHEVLKRYGTSVFKTLIWAKNNVIANQYYMNSHEYIIFFGKGKRCRSITKAQGQSYLFRIRRTKPTRQRSLSNC